jgi:hypothetical protein
MKTVVTAALLALSLSACAGLADSSRGSTAYPSDGAATPSADYGFRDATRDYPYNPPQY